MHIQAELDRFCNALISIREEIRAIENGEASPHDNVLKVCCLGNDCAGVKLETFPCGHRRLVDLMLMKLPGLICVFFSCVQGAPHPASIVIADEWTKPYSREVAAFPASWVRASKFWPTTGYYLAISFNFFWVCRLGLF